MLGILPQEEEWAQGGLLQYVGATNRTRAIRTVSSAVKPKEYYFRTDLNFVDKALSHYFREGKEILAGEEIPKNDKQFRGELGSSPVASALAKCRSRKIMTTVDRPSMEVVVQMLEGEGDKLTMPPNPFASTNPTRINVSMPARHLHQELEVILASE
ncbi:hypothetical protein CFP56_004096 [Quercus suber]|uniref:Uncharacterized protein n=1 Tax=Quercus suber TaxID=58331 RepID=A0AAW0I4Z7_QUESU